MNALPRALVVGSWHWQANAADSVAAMSVPDFDPREMVILIGSGDNQMMGTSTGQATITEYAPERVVVETVSETPGVLVLADAYYPGWTATLDGQAWPIYQADVLFRAIMIPAGQHTAVFSFTSPSFENGRLLSILGLAIWFLLVVIGTRTGNKEDHT
jgi:hypothetical protein